MKRILIITILVMTVAIFSAHAQEDDNDRSTDTELQRNLDSVENNTRAEDVNLDTVNNQETRTNLAGEALDPDASMNNSDAERNADDTKTNSNPNRNKNRKSKNK